MKVEISKCTMCELDKPIVNRTHRLCSECNRIRLDNQKLPEVKKLKLNSILKTSQKLKERAVELQKIYDEIANERKHECSGCNSTSMLTHSHIIPRSQRKDLECEKKNILYDCMKCHLIWEHGTLKEKTQLINFDERMNYIEKIDITYYNLITQKWAR